MFVDTKLRTDQPELMDDLSMEGDQLRRTLDQIASLNKMLGGNAITRDGVAQLIQSLPLDETVTIVDLGCGNGDMLRMLSDFAVHEGRTFQLIGIDANVDTVRYARELSAVYPNIAYLTADIFGPELEQLHFDIALCTLTLHHFESHQIESLMRRLVANANVGIVINDLERSGVAYRLFQLMAWTLRFDDMPRNDGLVSILRGFKRHELVALSQKLKIEHYTLRWKWAFRYQWVIQNL